MNECRDNIGLRTSVIRRKGSWARIERMSKELVIGEQIENEP